ncbi:hypothetical protein Tco_0097722 [Tanacetum coccineum]
MATVADMATGTYMALTDGVVIDTAMTDMVMVVTDMEMVVRRCGVTKISRFGANIIVVLMGHQARADTRIITHVPHVTFVENFIQEKRVTGLLVLALNAEKLGIWLKIVRKVVRAAGKNDLGAYGCILGNKREDRLFPFLIINHGFYANEDVYEHACLFRRYGHLKRRNMKKYASDIHYAVSIKEDTAYLCLHFTKDHEGNKINTPYPENPIRRIQVIECEDFGRYQTWSLLQETPNTPYRPFSRPYK